MEGREIELSQEIDDLKDKQFRAPREGVDGQFDQMVGKVREIFKDKELSEEEKQRLYGQISKPEVVRKILDHSYPEGIYKPDDSQLKKRRRFSELVEKR
jgi:hypothetical protein